MKNTKKEALLTSVLLTQQFSNGFWDNDWNKELLESADIEKILEEIVRRVSEVTTVTEAYAINHDKDTSVKFDKKLQETTTNTQTFSKSNLVHCLLTVDFKILFSSP